MTAPRIACVVPALNAAPALPAVVDGLRRALRNSFIVVIDDGSTDNTFAVARGAADVAMQFTRNRGKGAALRAGFDVALENQAAVIVTVDADGQHDPAFASDLVAALRHADVAIGARRRSGGRMPVGRRLTNSLSAAAVARCVGRRIDDAQSGFRALRSTVALDVKPRGDRYEFETEFLIVSARRGYRVAFVPIPVIYDAQVKSQFRPVRDSARIIGTLWRFGLGAER